MTFTMDQLATWLGIAAVVVGALVGFTRLVMRLAELKKSVEEHTLGLAAADKVETELQAKLAEVARILDDLKSRHSELAKETRERISAAEHRTNGLERWQAAVDAKLAGIHDTLVEVRTILSRKEGNG